MKAYQFYSASALDGVYGATIGLDVVDRPAPAAGAGVRSGG